MDIAEFFREQASRHESEQKFVTSLLSYGVLAFGAVGWFLITEGPALDPLALGVAMGLGGALFLHLIGPGTDRLIAALHPSPTPRLMPGMSEEDREKFLDGLAPQRLIQWQNAPDVVACVFAAVLGASIALYLHERGAEAVFIFYVSAIALAHFLSAGYLLFAPRAARRRPGYGLDARTWLGAYVRADPRVVSRLRHRIAPGDPTESRIARIAKAVRRFAIRYYAAVFMSACTAGAIYVMHTYLAAKDLLGLGVAIGATASLVALALLVVKLVQRLTLDGSRALLERMRHSIVTADVPGGGRIDAEQARNAVTALEMMHEEGIVGTPGLSSFLAAVEARGGAATPGPGPAAADTSVG